MKLFSTLITLFFTTSGVANLHPQAHHFGIQGELLYLQPNLDAFSFVTEVINEGLGFRNIGINTDYKLGYRVEGVYAIDNCYNVHTRVTYFNHTYSKEFTGTLSLFLSINGTAENDFKFGHYAIEGLIGRWLFDSCDFDLELEFGILYSNLRLNSITTFIVDPAFLLFPAENSSNFWGVGPEIAFNFEYPLFWIKGKSLAIAADVRAALLKSTRHEKLITIGGETNLSDPISGIVPAFDSRIGLNWNFCAKRFNGTIEIGYEWIYYQKVFSNILNSNEISYDLSFDGPYFALGASF